MASKVYDVITERVLELLEKGVVPWQRPWNSSGVRPMNLVSKKEYRGVNAFLLGSVGYEMPWWVTFKQAGEAGGKVKKGQHGFPVVYWNWIEPKEKGSNAESRDEMNGSNGEKAKNGKVPFLRYYTVFNVEQTEGIEVPPGPPKKVVNSIEEAVSVYDRMPNGPSLEHHGDRAFYKPSSDLVVMPPRNRFKGAEEYYSTLFHELTHSTGHQNRLSRPGLVEAIVFGSDRYSKEELVAEMGATFLCGHVGIVERTLDNSAAYINNWLGRLNKDRKLVVQAGGQAQKAVDYILGMNGNGENGNGGGNGDNVYSDSIHLTHEPGRGVGF